MSFLKIEPDLLVYELRGKHTDRFVHDWIKRKFPEYVVAGLAGHAQIRQHHR